MIRLAGIAAFLALASLAPNAHAPAPVDQKPSADPRDLHHCTLTALRPADNDIRFAEGRRATDRSVEMPAAVSRKILDHVSLITKRRFTREEWIESKLTCGEIFAPVFKLGGPDGLNLYVVQRYFPLGNSVDYFFMHNPRTGAVTTSPPLIYTKWSEAIGPRDQLIKRPIVRMEPAAKGQPARLIVQERTHNGNVYDAAVYRYFEIGKDMSLTQVLAVEARAILLSDLDEHTERKATFLTPNRVRLDVSSRSPRKLGVQGSVLLERAHAGKPFHVARRMPARGSGTEGLITYCESSAKGDDGFLRVGCDFYY